MNHCIVDPEPGSPALHTDSLLSEPPGKPIYIILYVNYQSIKKGKQNYLLVCLFWPCHRACRILVPRRRIEPGPWQWKHQILATRAPENFLISILNYFFLRFSFQLQDHTELFVLLEATKNILYSLVIFILYTVFCIIVLFLLCCVIWKWFLCGFIAN